MPTVPQLKKILVTPGHISPEQFDAAIKEAKENKLRVEDILVEHNYVTERELGTLLAEVLGVPFADLSKEAIDSTVHKLIPEVMARSKNIVAFGRSPEGIKLGMVDPMDTEAIHIVEKRAGEPVIPFLITKFDFMESLREYRSRLEDAYGSLLTQLETPRISSEEREQIIVKMVDLILERGQQNAASDIHIEPYARRILVRFRIDGILHTVLELPKSLGEQVTSRIKILARMRTDEHRAAQDGKFQLPYGNETVDVRVSVVPITNGENIVMRLLSSRSRRYSLKDLGMAEEDLLKVERALMYPHGMLLVTGPTGSGKTTTVYAMLKILNKPEVHIATIEDPVEYDIEGITQIQVNSKTNLTFAEGLRAIVRQDPDIILVGEVRDKETAGIAVNSAMTGHLVLSTLHANDAATTLPRLLDMGIEPFLISSTVRLVIAQRLARKVCSRCRASYDISKEESILVSTNLAVKGVLAELGYDDVSRLILFRGKGCNVCNHTGYSGRIGIFELMDMQENLRHLIVERTSSNVILAEAKRNGMKTMLVDGIKKALEGLTTLDEILRIISE